MEPTHITVRCPECGFTKDVSVAFEGQKIHCPNCANPFVVGIIESEPEPALKPESSVPPMTPAAAPKPAETAETPPPASAAPTIKLKNESTPVRPAPAAAPSAPSLSLRAGTRKEEPGPVCRGCQMVLEPGARVCSHCGMNQVTGRYVAAERAARTRVRRLLGFVALLAVLGGGGWWLWSQGWILKARQATEKAIGSVREAISGESPESPPPKAPEYTPEQKAELERTIAARVRDQVERTAPMYESGMTVGLDQLDGQHVEGVFQGYGEENTIQIETRFDGVVAVPIGKLRPLFRIRCERIYREQWIEQEIRRQIAAALAPKPVAPETR